jgi:hypothetical protein
MASPRKSSCHNPARPARRPAAVWRDGEWERALGLLPSDLEASARASGALHRRRAVRSAADLLRLALAYALSGWPLRLVAAWAAVSGLGQLSDVAVLYRLRASRAWLGALAAALVLARRAAAVGRPVRLRLIDATTISRPGSGGADWRVHLSLELGPGGAAIDGLELTDGRGAEALTRHPAGAGDVLVADRGHARRTDLGAVLASGAAVVVRIGWQNLPLREPGGGRLDLLGWLRPLAAPGERPALIETPRGTGALRLVATPLPAEAAETARRRLRRVARKKGRTPDARSLEAAGYVMLVTNLPRGAWDAAAVLALYRVRWQVELAFKRLKGIWHLDELRAREADLAQAYLLATLLGALLAERAAGGAPASCAAWLEATERPLSLWRWALLWHALVRDAVLGPVRSAALLPALPGLRRHLCDPPRRRPQQAAHARRDLRQLTAMPRLEAACA